MFFKSKPKGGAESNEKAEKPAPSGVLGFFKKFMRKEEPPKRPALSSKHSAKPGAGREPQEGIEQQEKRPASGRKREAGPGNALKPVAGASDGPAARPAPSVKPGPDSLAQAPAAFKILLVDDELSFERILGAFAKEFASLKAASSAHEAAKHLKSEQFDMVIIKANLPGKDENDKGISLRLAAAIRKGYPRVYIVLVTLGGVPAKETWPKCIDFFCRKGGILGEIRDLVAEAKNKRAEAEKKRKQAKE